MIQKHAITSPLPVAADGGDPPKEFILIHKGKNESENGPYIFDEVSAKSVMEGYLRRGVRCFFDYHHASLDEHPVDPRLAIQSAGWYDLEIREGDLWATNIDWTPDALDDFKNKRLAYFSPAFDSDKSGRVLDYINTAITNMPATHNNEQLVAAERPVREESTTMAMTEEERKSLEEAKKTAEEACKAKEESDAKYKGLEESFKKLEARLKSFEEDDSEDAGEQTEVKEEAPPPVDPKDHPEPDGDEGEDEDEDEDAEPAVKSKHSVVSSRAALNKEIVRLTRELATLRGASKGQDITSLTTQVTMAVRRGIITKAQKPWALSNPKAFSRLCNSFKGHTTVQTPAEPPVQQVVQARTVTDSERKMCREFGVSEEDYLKSLTQ